MALNCGSYANAGLIKAAIGNGFKTDVGYWWHRRKLSVRVLDGGTFGAFKDEINMKMSHCSQGNIIDQTGMETSRSIRCLMM